jgi:clan AA aspartic protease
VILGHVIDRTPYVKLSVSGQSSSLKLEIVIDTGFNGELALPRNIIERLNVPSAGKITVRLADGSYRDDLQYIAMIEWCDEQREVEIISICSGSPLMGIELLEGNLLTIEMADGGEVTIDPL